MNITNRTSAINFGTAGQRQEPQPHCPAHSIAYTSLPGRITALKARRLRIATVGFAPLPLDGRTSGPSQGVHA